MAEGGYKSQEIPYADDESDSADEACFTNTRAHRVKDDTAILKTEAVWETLKFKVYIEGTYYEYDVTKDVDICKFQFVLTSDIARKEFLARQRENIELEICPGEVRIKEVVVEWKKIGEFWNKLIQSFNAAIDSKSVSAYKFRSKTELENALQKLNDDTKHLITSGIVGVFYSQVANVGDAKFVGARSDLDTIIQELFTVMEGRSGQHTAYMIESDQHGVDPKFGRKNEFKRSVTITEDEDFYLHAVKYTEEMKKKFPAVRVETEGVESKTVKFFCAEANELQNAVSWFNHCKNEMVTKELEVSERCYKFITESENVQTYLKINLRKVPAELRFSSNSVYVLCQECNFATCDKIVCENIKTDIVDSKLSNHEALKIQKKSRDKIRYFEGYEVDSSVVLYTADVTTQAHELVKRLQNFRYVQERQYSNNEIKWMKAVGVLEDLKEKFRDILIDEHESVFILRATENYHLIVFLEELDTKVKNLELVRLNFLPELALKLIKNPKVQSHVEKRSKEKISFQENGTCFVFVKENEKSKISICREIQFCFVEMKIDAQCLNTEKGRSFFSKHTEEVAKTERQANAAFVNICFIADLSEEVKGLLYSYSKDCPSIVGDYLKKFGDRFLSEIQKKHMVGIELQNNRLCVNGPYTRGEKVVAEIESHVDIEVLHFGDLEYQQTEISEKDRDKLHSISTSCKCSMETVVFPLKNIENDLDTGIEKMCTWTLPNKNEEISVAKIDFNVAKLDGLIIPVNECLFGENIFGDGETCYAYPNMSPVKHKIGYFNSVKPTGKDAHINIFALVTSESCLIGNDQSRKYIDTRGLQRSCADIMQELFSNGKYKIGFALLDKDHSLRGKLGAILSGFQKITQLNDHMPPFKLLLGVRNEPEKWIQEVDEALKQRTYARRHISARYNGLLNRPVTNVKTLQTSITETGADCIVVAVSPDLDLSKGFVSNIVSQECGKQLKDELDSKYDECLNYWEFVLCQSYNLSRKGIQKLILGVIPPWEKCQKIEDLEEFIENCLLLADQAGCSTVAFPALGTGKLQYPLRDVAMALFNGVDKYVSEAIIGQVSTVYFSVPKKDDCMYQFLEEEQKRRKSTLDYAAGEKHLTNDQKYLVAEHRSVNYNIVPENLCNELTNGSFVNVEFEPGKDYISVNTIQPFRIKIKCQNTKEGLKAGVRELACLCEKEKITSINVFCSKDFGFDSLTEQIDIISRSVEEAVHLLDQENSPVFEYLKNVRIVASDPDFPNILYGLKMNEGNRSMVKTAINLAKSYVFKGTSPNTAHPLSWKIVRYQSPISRQCLNVVLAGCKDSDLARAEDEIRQYITRRENDNADFNMNEDRVSAELNPGIVKYLRNLPKDVFEKWKKEFISAFEMQMVEINTHIEISGAFSNILRTEEYFENDFPQLPQNDHAGLSFSPDHYKKPASSLVQIPVEAQQSACIRKLFRNEIENLKSNKHVQTINILENAVTVTCQPSLQSEVKQTLAEIVNETKHLTQEKVFLSSKEEIDLVLKTTDIQENVLCIPIPNVKKHAVKIIGRKKVSVENAVRHINEQLRKEKNRHVDVAFTFEKAIFKIKNFEMSVLCNDITDLDVDCIVSPVNEKMHIDTGVAKYIANKAGKTYKEECKDKSKLLNITECVETGPGALRNCKHVIHVHSPLMFNHNKMQDQLLQLKFSVENCLRKANHLGLRSIAIPFIGAGNCNFPIEHCAIQYFKAVDNAEEASTLEKLYLVDVKKEKVSEVCIWISSCLHSKVHNLLHAELTIKTSMEHVKYYFGHSQMHEVVLDAVVLKVDQKLRDRGKDVQHILTLSGKKFKDKFYEQCEKTHDCPTVIPIQTDMLQLRCKYVMFAVIPELKGDPERYARLLNTTVQQILQCASERDISTIAFPVLCFEDDDLILKECCDEMVSSFLQCAHKQSRKIKQIHFLTMDSNALTKLACTMVEMLKSGKIKV